MALPRAEVYTRVVEPEHGPGVAHLAGGEGVSFRNGRPDSVRRSRPGRGAGEREEVTRNGDRHSALASFTRVRDGGQGPGAWGVVMTPLRDSVSWEAEDTKASDVTTR